MPLVPPLDQDITSDPTQPWQRNAAWPFTHRPKPKAQAPAVGAAVLEPDRFSQGSFNFQRQSHQYKVYVPPQRRRAARPCLIVMLHGCGQNPDDFATGTRMNALAREANAVVLYPAQSREANPHGCWNWFEAAHQGRGQGEPAWIAALTRWVASRLDVDGARIYVAGLSAGGTMASTVAQCYPELFAACGVHSALAPRAAQGAINALSIMQNGHWSAPVATRAVPTIVLHGADDDTVHPAHGRHAVLAALGRGSDAAAHFDTGLRSEGENHVRTVFRGADRRPQAEHWELSGHGHAWSGGDPAGSHSVASGPDASREMLRFFFAVAPPQRAWLARIRHTLAQAGEAVAGPAVPAL